MGIAILGLGALNTILIIYLFRKLDKAVTNHYFYYGRPDED
jgi:hypothetical protein|tara:strand:- start:550 stop:672 length:123 start_codon:yes stop_codon:yes gene_type:complete